MQEAQNGSGSTRSKVLMRNKRNSVFEGADSLADSLAVPGPPRPIPGIRCVHVDPCNPRCSQESTAWLTVWQPRLLLAPFPASGVLISTPVTPTPSDFDQQVPLLPESRQVPVGRVKQSCFQVNRTVGTWSCALMLGVTVHGEEHKQHTREAVPIRRRVRVLRADLLDLTGTSSLRQLYIKLLVSRSSSIVNMLCICDKFASVVNSVGN